VIVNLDPANEDPPYECAIDIAELVDLQNVMEEENLGPNGALMFCMEYIEANIDWLLERLESYTDQYILFDFPGQVELYTHHDSVRRIVQTLQNQHSYRLTAVHLIDSFYCSQPTTFISVLLTSLNTMLKLELPHVNVLSKIDAVLTRGDLDFNLEFYTDVLDLSYLIRLLDNDRYSQRMKKLNEVLVGLIEDYGLVSFHTLCIEDKGSVYNLLKSVDKANGFVFGGLTPGNESIFRVADTVPFQDQR